MSKENTEIIKLTLKEHFEIKGLRPSQCQVPYEQEMTTSISYICLEDMAIVLI